MREIVKFFEFLIVFPGNPVAAPAGSGERGKRPGFGGKRMTSDE
jgi:hypothetical protein